MGERSVEGLTVWAGLVGAAVGVVGTIVVGSFGYFNKDRELDIQMVNVGLSILRGEATGDKDTTQAKRFALRVLKKYADVEIPDDEFEAWVKDGETPYLLSEIYLRQLNESVTGFQDLVKQNEELVEKLDEDIADRAAKIEKIK